MNDEPDVTEVVEAVERLRRNYRKPLPGQEPLEAADTQPNEDTGKKDKQGHVTEWRRVGF